VLECDDMPALTDGLIEELIVLRDRVEARGGVMRLAGLSADNRLALARCQRADRIACYADRAEAVMANRPRQPR
jgi:hypothetical protein